MKGHPYGHIAIKSDNSWISDFKQKSFYVANAYRFGVYKIYRFPNNIQLRSNRRGKK